MARADDTELIDTFEEFYRSYYRNEIGELAQKYPNEQKSLYIDWDDLYRFDPHLADDFRNKPEQLKEYAEEALRLYDLPVDVSLGQAHVRVRGLPEQTDIREIRSDHRGMLIAVQGIVRKATDVRPKITTAAFECQRCGTLTRIPQEGGDFQEPHECQGCERQGPFRINYDQSEFIDAQKLRVQESPEGLRGGETPQSVDVNIEDDITGEVTAGDHVRVSGILKLDQQGSEREKSPMFDFYMNGMAVEIEDEQFEEMDITDEDKKEIIELSNEPNIYEKMEKSIAPSIYGYTKEKRAMIFQLFSGVTKHLPDGSRTRGDLHMLLIGDPGTGKCMKGDETVALADGTRSEIRDIVESNLSDPKSIDDGVYDTADIRLPTMTAEGKIKEGKATKVWKREAPEQMYRIQTSRGKELEVTPSHPLFVQDDGDLTWKQAKELQVDQFVAAADSFASKADTELEIQHSDSRTNNAVTDGGVITDADTVPVDRSNEALEIESSINRHRSLVESDIRWEQIEAIETVEPEYEWVYDLEVAGTHNYISEGIISHNSQMLQYVKEIAPRSVYTSGKGSSSAGLTAAAVRDDFGDGQQWTLEAGALVLADQGIAAVDELDKMRCVTGDTLVHTAEGISPIERLARKASHSGSIEEHETGRTIRDVNFDVWTMSEDNEIVKRPVTAVHEYPAPQNLYTVKLESGESVIATADHPFFVLSEGEKRETPAEELERGDLVPVPNSIPPTTTDGGVSISHDESKLSEEPINSNDDIVWEPVKTVEQVSSSDEGHHSKVYDLTVEGTHNFVANSIIVHNSEDQSAMHEALEQQSISVSKAGINATLKSRCSLLGAANPTYGRFDQYEPIGEQIDLDPPLISRFDLIFTVTDNPNEEKDAELAEHILKTNYAGELNTHREHMSSSDYTEEEVKNVTDDVAPEIDAELLRKYIAYAKRNCYPTMTEDAKSEIQDFYVQLRAQGSDEDAPVPVTARKLEALVRLAEASARVRLSDTVEMEDAERATAIARYCLEEIGMDPETGEFDADVIETGTSKSQRDRIKNIKHLISTIEEEYDEGAPVDVIIDRAEEEGIDNSKAEHEIDKLKQQGEVYEPRNNHLRTT